MSDQDQTNDAAFDDKELATNDELATEDTAPKPPGRVLPVIAILLSLFALAAAGFLLLAEFRADPDEADAAQAMARLSSRVDASRETIVALQNRVSEQSQTLTELRQRVSAAESTLDDPSELLGSLPSRLGAVERSVAGLQGTSADTRDFWLLSEAEYYLQIANAQAELAGNPVLASAALGQADERLKELASPAYTDVRAAIADELAQLELMTTADVAGLTLTLASLSRVVDSLPVRQRDDGESTEEEAETGEDVSGISRAWASVKEAMGGLVKVTKPGGESSPLLTPDAAILLRANLTLQLQAARLALLKGERAVFEQSLVDAEDWIMTYFDIRSVQVTSALETITEIRNSPAMEDIPDISRSLRLLRQTRMLQENAG